MNTWIHDAVADGYVTDAGVIATAHQRVDARLRLHQRQGQPLADLLDIGVGDGALLARLHGMLPTARMTGLDVSVRMLERAERRAPITTVLGPAQAAAELLAGSQYDVILAHFILAYVPPSTLFQQVRPLLREDGMLSLVTTTFEQVADEYRAMRPRLLHRRWRLLQPWVQRVTDTAMSRCSVPQDLDALRQAAAQAGLSISHHERLRDTLTLRTPAEFYRHTIVEGWGVQLLEALGGWPGPLRRGLVRLVAGMVRYPIAVTRTVEILELRQVGRETRA